jgi:tripartite-type tricarboxylate transporter receptor subunit TctC
MSFPRRRFLHLAAGTAALPAMSRMARAQTYPTRPITIIVGAAVGGPTDTIARIITQHMRESLHQSIIIENNGAASGTIAPTHRPRRAKRLHAEPRAYVDTRLQWCRLRAAL